MKLSELAKLAEKGPVVVGSYVIGKPDKIERAGKPVIYLERHFVVVDGEVKEYGRMLDKLEDSSVGKFKQGEMVAVKLQLRPDKKEPRAFRVSAHLEPVAA